MRGKGGGGPGEKWAGSEQKVFECPVGSLDPVTQAKIIVPSSVLTAHS